jgi:hypothetical protein
MNYGVLLAMWRRFPICRFAGFQPAADPANPRALRTGERSADWKSAIQQVGNLRYEPGQFV